MIEDPTKRFSDRVDNYVKYRPSYPKGIIELLKTKIGLTAEWIIADIGSGTGIATELFLSNGNTVYAVEPNPEMRKAAEEKLFPKYDKFFSIKGRSDQTLLDDSTIDLIIVCQAFHWFDLELARKEFKYILRPGGYIAIIYNERKRSTPFLSDYEDLLKKYAENYKALEIKNMDRESLIKFFGTDNYSIEKLPNYQTFDFEGLRGRLLSSSYAPKEGTQYEQMLTDLKNIFDKHQENGKVLFEYDTNIYFSKIY